jgi:hypothetical protein
MIFGSKQKASASVGSFSIASLSLSKFMSSKLKFLREKGGKSFLLDHALSNAKMLDNTWFQNFTLLLGLKFWIQLIERWKIKEIMDSNCVAEMHTVLWKSNKGHRGQQEA